MGFVMGSSCLYADISLGAKQKKKSPITKQIAQRNVMTEFIKVQFYAQIKRKANEFLETYPHYLVRS